MSTYRPQVHRFSAASLTADSQAKLERLIKLHGVAPTADMLGSTTTTVENVREGGKSRAATVDRIERKLAGFQ